MNKPNSSPRDTFSQWTIGLFDVLTGLLSLIALLASIQHDQSNGTFSASEYPWNILNAAGLLLTGLSSVTLLGAAFSLFGQVVSGKRTWWKCAYLLQRLGFWCLFLVTAMSILTLIMASEGGVGGFLTLITLPFFLLFTSIAYFATTNLRTLCNNSKGER